MKPNSQSPAIAKQNEEIQINSRSKSMRNQSRKYSYPHNNVNDGHAS